MKKIFTLMTAVIIVASASAQNDNGNHNGYGNNDRDRDIAVNDRSYNHNDDRRDDRMDDRYRNNFRERDMKIATINQEYDRKIESVRRKWFMSRSKREDWIYQLDGQRRDEIRRVYMRFHDSNDHFDNDRGRH